MTNWIRISLLLALTLCCTLAKSQSDIQVPKKNEVIIEFRNGDIIEGEVINWVPESHIIIKTAWDTSDRYELSKVRKVVQKSALSQIGQSLKPYNFKEKGIYYAVRANFIAANQGNRASSQNGFGMSVSAGYRFNRLLGLGLGTGYDQYIWNSGEELIPIFVELNGFLKAETTTPFYNIQTGYSIALQDEGYLITDSKGGWMLYPAIGIRFGHEKTKFTLDVGYKFQNAQFTYQDVWTSTSFREQTLTYKRLSLRFGILL